MSGQLVVGSAQGATIASMVSMPEKGNTRIPFKQEPELVGRDAVWVIAILLLVLLAVLWWLRNRVKRGPMSANGRRARVLESHRLGPRSTLAVVEFAGQWHLIAQNEHSITSIAQAPAGERQ